MGPSRLLQEHAGVENPPSPTCKGAFPTSLGMRPTIGPPLAAAAGVLSVWLAPALSGATHRSGVMPWTCPSAVPADMAASDTARMTPITKRLMPYLLAEGVR